MRTAFYIITGILLLVVGVAGGQEPTEGDEALDRYFKIYCDYTGGLPSHSYDYDFRQRLKITQDRELKRLFVLHHLSRDMMFAVSDFEDGVIVIGKNKKRAMTPAERVSIGKKIAQQLNDLSVFDPKDTSLEISGLKERFEEAQASPPK